MIAYYIEIVNQCDFDKVYKTGIASNKEAANKFVERMRIRFNIEYEITDKTPLRDNGFNATITPHEVIEN